MGSKVESPADQVSQHRVLLPVMVVRSLNRTLGLALCLVSLAWSHAYGGNEIDSQRELFLDVYETVERGDWSPVDDLSDHDLELLRRYVLWPDLRAAFYRATIKTADPGDIEQFLKQHGTLKPARELRYRYALQHARRGELASYLTIYQQFYQGLKIEKLDCLALQAELEAGRGQRVAIRAIELWAVGKSQVDECDPVFTYLRDNDLIGPAEFAKRFALAIAAHEFALAHWLAKSIDQEHVDVAAEWLKAQGNPEKFVRSHRQRANTATAREQLTYAIERITFADPLLAQELWAKLTTRYQFSAPQQHLTDRHIALWMARDNLPGAYKRLAKLSVAAQNDEVLRWRARVSIRAENWKNLLANIAKMSMSERNSEEWKYWHAVALQARGRVTAATEAFESLASERSYYGFLAADELGLAYALEHGASSADESVITELAARSDLIRARELFLVGLEGRGRSEWDAVVSYFGADEKTQAAILAHRWGWHSRAISTAASVGQFDDLALRYPLPYRETFQRHAQSANISATWAYGIARAESLFMRDVRSSAGAIGLMQLMPATGRIVAREIKLPYSGLDTLTDAEDNIRLGTSYLAKITDRYGGNRVLATAAYNAGPQRVDQWLPDSGTIDARIWIENIPFNETRKYVRRVLAAEIIFHWRMTGETRRLSDELAVVRAAGQTQRLAIR